MTISRANRREGSHFAPRFWKDQRGIASIEFMLIFPLLLALLFGTVQFTAGFAALRKVTVVSRTMSDLISQAIKVCTADIDNALMVGKSAMWPYPTTDMSATISQVFIDPQTHAAKVDWSRGSNERAVGSAVTVPTGIAVDGRYLIMSEVTYNFTPTIGFKMEDHFQGATVPMSRTSFTTPRQTIKVTRTSSCS